VKSAITNGVRHFYEFGPFRLDPNKHRLFRGEEVVPLSPKAIETLILLVQNQGKLLQREALMHALWPDTVVEDANLTVAVSQLRRVINQNGDKGEFIQTIPRLGYRFVADVTTVEGRPNQLSAAAQHAPHAETAVDESNGAGSDSKELLPEQSRALIASAKGRQTLWRRVVTATAIFMLLVIGWLLFSSGHAKLPRTTAQVKTMAVLPFKILSADPADEYLGVGLADTLITQIDRISQILVRPTSSSKYAETHALEPLAAGRLLRVEAVLDGTVQHDADNLRVTARLLRVGDGTLLWSGKFDEKFTDVFAVQDSISQEVAAALTRNLRGEDRKLLTKHHTDNPEAFRAYLKGRYFWNKRTPDGLQQSLAYFRQAIDLDPVYSSAYAGMADAYALLVWQEQLPRDDFIERAKAAATKALEIDETLAAPHATLGYVKFWYDWDFAGAESEFRRAIELDPDYATAHHWYGEALGLLGRFDNGFKELRLAEEVDSLSAIINADLGKLLFLARQPDQTIEQMQKTLELDPDLPLAHVFLALAWNKKGLHEQAIAELEKIAKAPGSRAIFKATLGFVYGQSGRKAEALSILDALIGSRSSGHYVSPFHIALVYVGLGKNDDAMEWLEKAKTERDPFLIYIKVDPNFDSLRNEPRFQKLLMSIGLTP
jgi:DNA-binding winged helix-turn-helix (wHTH) protein/TolB-like protein/tetratricopeptide (TPR) repeat protein